MLQISKELVGYQILYATFNENINRPQSFLPMGATHKYSSQPSIIVKLSCSYNMLNKQANILISPSRHSG